MITYISLLRGINVGGNKKIKMDVLTKLYGELGLLNVKTYIQSGNVIFDSSCSNVHELKVKIEDGIKSLLGFDVPVILRTKAELDEIIKNNPFGQKDTDKLHVAFLSGTPEKLSMEDIEKARDESEKYLIWGQEIYIYYNNGVGRSKISNNLFERCLKVSATTRNWNTVNKLSVMAGSALLLED